jgi:hypothetical protein
MNILLINKLLQFNKKVFNQFFRNILNSWIFNRISKYYLKLRILLEELLDLTFTN